MNQRRDRVALDAAAGERADRHAVGRERDLGGGVAKLGHDALRELGADAVGAAHQRLVAGGDGAGEFVGAQDREDRERDPRAHPLDALEAAEPFALGAIGEAEQIEAVLAHMGLDQKLDRLARPRQRAQRAARALNQIADPADVDHHMVLGQKLDQPGEARDHEVASASAQRRRVAAWWAWQMATASASAASLPLGTQPGSRRRTISATWRLSACPVPTPDFLTRLARKSVV